MYSVAASALLAAEVRPGCCRMVETAAWARRLPTRPLEGARAWAARTLAVPTACRRSRALALPHLVVVQGVPHVGELVLSLPEAEPKVLVAPPPVRASAARMGATVWKLR